MSGSTEPKICRKCGQPLGGLAPEGVCSRCLLLTGFDEASDGTTREPDPDSRKVGRDGNLPREFGDYELLEEIARGGMGIVYRARQLSLDRIVAIKMMLLGQYTSDEFIHRFRAEASTAASLRHPNIVAIHEVGLHQGQHYFAMDFVNGPNLAQFIRNQRLPAKQAAAYVKAIAEAIQFAHQRGILHRDLKPSNILIDSSDQPHITDFGLAKRFGVPPSAGLATRAIAGAASSNWELTVTGQMLGSPNYMPPEQASVQRGGIGPHSDIYSLGAILYHALTGRPPFMGETLADTLQLLLHSEPVVPRLLSPAVPVDLETICLKCLEREPVRRYTTAQELADELGRFTRGEPIQARPISTPEKLWRWCRRKPALAALILLVQVVGAVGLGGIIWEWYQERAQRFESQRILHFLNFHRANEALETHDLAGARLLLNAIAASPVQLSTNAWEWRYLAGRCRGDQSSVLDAQEAPLWGVAASPDGRWLASINADGRAKVWEFSGRKETNSWLAHANQSGAPDMKPHAVVFTPTGNTLITAGSDHHFRLWEVPSGKKLAEVRLMQSAARLAISRNGQMLACGTLYSERLSLWSLSTSSPSLLQEGSSSLPMLGDLTFAPDGLTLYAGGPGAQSVRRFDISDPTGLRRLPALEDSDGPLAVSPDGRWLATARADDLPVRLWALPSLAPVATDYVHGSRLVSLRFSPNSEVLAGGCEDGKIILWSTTPFHEMLTFLGHERQVIQMDFSADGKSLVSASLDKTVRLWDLTAGERAKWSVPMGGPGHDVNFSPDSKQLVSASMATVAAGTREPQRMCVVKLWDVDDRRGLTVRAAITNLTPDLYFHVNFSPDGTVVVEDTYDKLRFLQVPALKQFKEVELRFPCWERSGQWLAYVGAQHHIVRSDSPSKPLSRSGSISALALSPDGHILASAWRNANSSIELQDARNGHPLGPPLTGHDGWVTWLAFSPDGKTLASASWDDGSIGIWDVISQRRRDMLRGHNGSVFKLAFSPDGATLATCGSDETVRLWNVARLHEVAVLRGHRGPVNGVAFSPDGRWLASASSDGTVCLWFAPTFEKIAGAKAANGHL